MSNTIATELQLSLGQHSAVAVFGVQEKNLALLNKQFPETRITVRGNQVKLLGPEDQTKELKTIIQEMQQLAAKNEHVSDLDMHTLITLYSSKHSSQSTQSLSSDPPYENKLEDPAPVEGTQIQPPKAFYSQPNDIITYTYQGKPIACKTNGQKQLFDAAQRNDIVFALGPAGTGKTFTSVAIAVRALKERRVRRIILARPAVEAGENLGFLPGDLKEKIDPYLRPLYDALEEMLEAGRLKMHMEKNIIEIAPLAYMRGRTLSDAFVILDEAQNTTFAQLKMFLTRIGQNSKCIITGDMTQTDLPKHQKSGLVPMPKMLAEIEGIEFVHLEQTDVLRHALVRRIIDAYDKFEQAKTEDDLD